VGFEPTNPEFPLAKAVHALGRADTVIGREGTDSPLNFKNEVVDEHSVTWLCGVFGKRIWRNHAVGEFLNYVNYKI
jgi:hypothetical protein